MRQVTMQKRWVLLYSIFFLFMGSAWRAGAAQGQTIPQQLHTEEDVVHAMKQVELNLRTAWKNCANYYGPSVPFREKEKNEVFPHLDTAQSYLALLQKFYAQENYVEPKGGSLAVKVASEYVTNNELILYRLALKTHCFDPMLECLKRISDGKETDAASLVGKCIVRCLRFWQEVPIALRSWDNRLTSFSDAVAETRRWGDSLKGIDLADTRNKDVLKEWHKRYETLFEKYLSLGLLMKEECSSAEEFRCLSDDLYNLCTLLNEYTKKRAFWQNIVRVAYNPCDVLDRIKDDIEILNCSLTRTTGKMPKDWEDMDEESRVHLDDLNEHRFAAWMKLGRVGRVMVYVKDQLVVGQSGPVAGMQELVAAGASKVSSFHPFVWVQKNLGITSVKQALTDAIQYVDKLVNRPSSGAKQFFKEHGHIIRSSDKQVMPRVDLKNEMEENFGLQELYFRELRDTHDRLCESHGVSHDQALRTKIDLISIKMNRFGALAIKRSDEARYMLTAALRHMGGLTDEQENKVKSNFLQSKGGWVELPANSLESVISYEPALIRNIEDHQHLCSRLEDTSTRMSKPDVAQSQLWFDSVSKRFVTLLSPGAIGLHRRQVLFSCLGLLNTMSWMGWHLYKRSAREYVQSMAVSGVIAAFSAYQAWNGYTWLSNHPYVRVGSYVISPKIVTSPENSPLDSDTYWNRVKEYFMPHTPRLAWSCGMDSAAQRLGWDLQVIPSRQRVASMLNEQGRKTPMGDRVCGIPSITMKYMRT